MPVGNPCWKSLSCKVVLRLIQMDLNWTYNSFGRDFQVLESFTWPAVPGFVGRGGTLRSEKLGPKIVSLISLAILNVSSNLCASEVSRDGELGGLVVANPLASPCELELGSLGSEPHIETTGCGADELLSGCCC